MLILNFAPAPPITATQCEQIRASVERHLDTRFVIVPLKVRVVDVLQKRTVEASLDACELTSGEWRTLPIAPRITADHPFAGALLAGVNERRGYVWPVILMRERDEHLHRNQPAKTRKST